MGNTKNTNMVYSTNSDYLNQFEQPVETTVTLPPHLQKLIIKLDTKQRGGKVVTLIEGFVGNENDLAVLGKNLKTKCGSGGTVKDGQILIQGNYKEKIIEWLKNWGYLILSK